MCCLFTLKLCLITVYNAEPLGAQNWPFSHNALYKRKRKRKKGTTHSCKTWQQIVDDCWRSNMRLENITSFFLCFPLCNIKDKEIWQLVYTARTVCSQYRSRTRSLFLASSASFHCNFSERESQFDITLNISRLIRARSWSIWGMFREEKEDEK